MVLRRLLAALLLVPPLFFQVSAGDLSTMDILRRAEYERVVISPDGTALAVAYRKDGGTLITVLRRADLVPIAKINPGGRAEVSALAWLGSRQLVIAANRSTGPYHAPIVKPAIFLADITRKHPKILPGSFFGTVEGDDQHVLALGCSVFSEDGQCRYSVQRMDVDHLNRNGERLALAPLGDATFLVDHAGVVRFAWGWSNTGRSRLYVRDGDDQWPLINDSDVSHVGVVPIGISRDNKTAFLMSERTDGPDAVERYDFASRQRTELLRDDHSDPLGVIFSMDGKEPIGAWIGPGRPHARYWAPNSDDAKWHRALAKAFPDSMASVVSSTTDGSVAVVRTQSDRDEGSFYILDRSSHKMSLLFHAMPWLDSSHMAASVPFTFKARDGLQLHGFLTRPFGADSPAPMVVVVHGGPYYIADAWRFDAETQLLAAHGYSVLQVNFRGSAGFGRHFRQLGYRQWGGAMQNDVTDATKWAIAQGIADRRRVCIYGASYGGYAALMGAARKPELYRCAIGLSGVYDLNKMYRWGDIHRSDYGTHYLELVLGKDTSVLRAHSPSALAASIKIPVLLAHGERDGRVPFHHAHAMQSALKEAGHPAEFVSYTWEGHSLGSPKNQRDFYNRLLAFLAKNLQSMGSKSTLAKYRGGSIALMDDPAQRFTCLVSNLTSPPFWSRPKGGIRNLAARNWSPLKKVDPASPRCGVRNDFVEK